MSDARTRTCLPTVTHFNSKSPGDSQLEESYGRVNVGRTTKPKRHVVVVHESAERPDGVTPKSADVL